MQDTILMLTTVIEIRFPILISRINVECIVSEAKRGHKEGLLNHIGKNDKPLAAYHLDHVGPM